ncbi:hypothetical protein MBLNU230_g1675t1 [Neophaeotheca triangularis]
MSVSGEPRAPTPDQQVADSAPASGDSGKMLTTAPFQGVAPTNPKPFVASLVGKDVRVRLKWSQPSEYIGKLVAVDSYMNLQLSGCKEIQGDSEPGYLGTVLIRCNNVLWLGADIHKTGQTNGDTAMNG